MFLLSNRCLKDGNDGINSHSMANLMSINGVLMLCISLIYIYIYIYIKELSTPIRNTLKRKFIGPT